MLGIWAFILLTLAAARAARFVVLDKLSRGIRSFAVRKYGTGFWLTTLIHCVACAAIWTSAPFAVLGIFLSHASWWWFVPTWWAMAYLAHLFVAKVDGEN